jgi:hypothetical protein
VVEVIRVTGPTSHTTHRVKDRSAFGRRTMNPLDLARQLTSRDTFQAEKGRARNTSTAIQAKSHAAPA